MFEVNFVEGSSTSNTVLRDDWTARQEAHRSLSYHWTGDTTFSVDLRKISAPVQPSADTAGATSDFSDNRLLIEFCSSEDSMLGRKGHNTDGC